MTENVQKNVVFYQKKFRITGMVIEGDVFDVSDKEILLFAIKHLKGFRFLNCR